MDFTIPATDSLSRYTVAALRDLALEAAAAFDSLKESLTKETVTDEQLDTLDDLKNFMLLCDEELSDRKSRSTRFSALTTPTKPLATDDDAAAGDEGEEPEGEEKPPATAPAKAKAPKITALVEGSGTALVVK